jgi:hypothetical protein
LPFPAAGDSPPRVSGTIGPLIGGFWRRPPIPPALKTLIRGIANEIAMMRLEQSDAVLVVGSSLMVYSGYRFAQAAAQASKPIAAVNLGRTRADELLMLKVAQPCATALACLLEGCQPIRN